MPDQFTTLEQTTGPDVGAQIERLTTAATEAEWIETNDGGVRSIITQGDQRLHLVDPAAIDQDPPRRKTGTAILRSVEAFNAYLDVHATAADASTVWADPKARKVTAVINDDTSGSADYRDHRAILDLGLTPEAEAILSLQGRKFSQETFAEWLEQWGILIAAPDAATIMEIVLTMEQTTNVAWRSAVRLADGQRRLGYEETTTTKAGEKGNLDVPGELTFVAPVYRGASPTSAPIRAMLRYRVEGADLRIELVLVRPDQWLDDAFDQALTDLAAEHGPILDGTPPPPVPVADIVTTIERAR